MPNSKRIILTETDLDYIDKRLQRGPEKPCNLHGQCEKCPISAFSRARLEYNACYSSAVSLKNLYLISIIQELLGDI